MLYSIILPIVIILSLAVIIIFLVKKTPAIRKVEEEGQFEEKLRRGEKKSLWKKTCIFCGESFFPGLKKTLVFLGSKIKQGIVSLFKGLFSRGNRKKNLKVEKTPEEQVLQKVKDYHPQPVKINKISREDEEDKSIRPMISDKVTNPKNKIEMKDRFEEILIERVAANPRDIEAYERLGEYYLEIGEHLDAKECFKQVIRLDSGNSRARLKMRKLEKELKR